MLVNPTHISFDRNETVLLLPRRPQVRTEGRRGLPSQVGHRLGAGSSWFTFYKLNFYSKEQFLPSEHEKQMIFFEHDTNT